MIVILMLAAIAAVLICWWAAIWLLSLLPIPQPSECIRAEKKSVMTRLSDKCDEDDMHSLRREI